MTALLPALLAAATESGAGLALWAVGMSALPMAIVLHGLASLLAAGGLARRTRLDERLYVFGTVLALPGLGLLGVAGVRLWAVLVRPSHTALGHRSPRPPRRRRGRGPAA